MKHQNPTTDALESKLADLAQWLKENALTKAGTLEYRQRLLTHRALNNFVTGNGSVVDKALMDMDLSKIADRSHPELQNQERLSA